MIILVPAYEESGISADLTAPKEKPTIGIMPQRNEKHISKLIISDDSELGNRQLLIAIQKV